MGRSPFSYFLFKTAQVKAFVPMPKSIVACISLILILFERSFIQNTISSFRTKFLSDIKTACIQLKIFFHLYFTKSMTVLASKSKLYMTSVMDLYTLNVPVGTIYGLWLWDRKYFQGFSHEIGSVSTCGESFWCPCSWVGFHSIG